MTAIEGFKYIKPVTVKGAGGAFDLAKVEIEFYVVSDKGECQLPNAFYRIKKYFSLAKVNKFLNPKNTGDYSTRANFKHVFPKMDIFGISKSIFCYIY